MDIIKEIYGNLPQKKCLNKGFVKLIDCMPRILPEGEKTADYAIAEAARCSYKGFKTISNDKTLIRHLMRKFHTGPFEQIEFKFYIKLPMYICTQVLRHRTASMNILSGRFSKITEEFYIPSVNNIRFQDNNNKQGSEGIIDNKISQEIIREINRIHKITYEQYTKNLEKGMAKEQARGILSYDIYTEMYWKIDLKNLLHFLALRCDEHAQQEIQVYAEAILELITPIVPITIEAWNDYDSLRGAIILTRLEIEKIKEVANAQCWDTGPINSYNKRERKEWVEKAKKLGIDATDIDCHD